MLRSFACADFLGIFCICECQSDIYVMTDFLMQKLNKKYMMLHYALRIFTTFAVDSYPFSDDIIDFY